VTSNNRLQPGSSAIRNNFGEDFPVAFKNTKNNCFAKSSRPRFPFMRRAPKQLSSTSTSPEKEDCRSQCWAFAYEFQWVVFRFGPEIFVIRMESKSIENTKQFGQFSSQKF
jgi:hypothetical protein